MSTTYPSDLSDAEWECLQEHFPSESSRGRPRTHSLRAICNAIFYAFLNQSINVIAVGKPGVGKSHIAAALGHELVLAGHPVLWTSTATLVQRLLAAKRDLRLPQELTRLDRFSCVILDDIGYVQQDRDEMEVLFTFLSERYEHKSVILTTNLVFSEWNRIFKDPMTTMAAIDRVVHHSVILDMMAVESYRAKEANQQHLQVQEMAAAESRQASSVV